MMVIFLFYVPTIKNVRKINFFEPFANEKNKTFKKSLKFLIII